MQSKFTKYEFSILSIVLVSYFMTVLDVSVVITALPKIQTDLNLSTANLTWVQNAYTIIFGGLLLLGGRLGDIIGRKHVFNFGLVIFGLGSLLVGLANSPMWLIIARGFQGAGAAALAPSTLALLMDSYSCRGKTNQSSCRLRGRCWNWCKSWISNRRFVRKFIKLAICIFRKCANCHCNVYLGDKSSSVKQVTKRIF